MSPLPSYAGVTRFWHPVFPAKSLRDRPVRVTVGDRDFALFRDAHKRPAALVDRCAHRFAPLSRGRVVDGRIECPYHGWSFDAHGCGRSPSQPTLTRCDVAPMQVIERDGYLWLADASADTQQIPRVRFDDGYAFLGTFSSLFEAPLHVCLDNFSEDEHTPWVHTRLGWRAQDAARIEYEASNHEDSTEVHYRAPQRPSRVLALFGIGPRALFQNDWVTRFDPVRTDYTITHVLADGRSSPLSLRAVIFMVPERESRTRFHVFLSVRDRDRLRRLVLPSLAPVIIALVKREIDDDARFIPTVAHTPYSFEGMRLGRFDKPLVHGRKLLDRIYLQSAR